jgi:ATP phosphoribosyltransferase regulatory subunit
MDQLLHTPEGVRDIYGKECTRKLEIESRIHSVFRSYGFEDIETPEFEFFDIFNKERGSVASKEMFKFFDRYNNTLVLRPDMTPQIARNAAKYFELENGPVKLCYKGKTFINNSSYQARLKETTQMGTELISDDSVDADAESVSMLIHALLTCGLKEFYVEIGQIQFFKGLVEEAGLDSVVEDQLRMLIQDKNYFGVEELLKSQQIDLSIGDVLLKLPQLFGSVEILDKAAGLTHNEKALAAIDRLRELYDILKIYGYEKYVSFDLGMLSNLGYYTGIIFQAYTYGTGEFIANGGRYDKLIGQFGKNRPSVGFSITVDYLMIAMDRQKIALENDENSSFLIVYAPKDRSSAIRLASQYRSKNINVSMICSGEAQTDFFADYAARHGAGHVVFLDGSDLTMYFVASGNIKKDKVGNVLE